MFASLLSAWRPAANAAANAATAATASTSSGVAVAKIAAAAATAVGFAAYSSAAQCEDKVYSWGWGVFGQLGQGDDLDRTLPTEINDLTNKGAVSAASSGCAAMSAVLTQRGNLYTFGSGKDGRLGHGFSFEGSSEGVPRLVDRLAGKVKIVSLGEMHGACVLEDGTVWTWGKDRGSLLGHKKKEKGYPHQVEGIDGLSVKDISCGRQHTAILTTDGKVYTWGTGRDGALGHGSRSDEDTPKLVEALADRNIVSIATGKVYTLALTCCGSVFAFGGDNYGQLGQGHSDRYQRSPVLIKALEGKDIVAIAAGESHSIAISGDGRVFAWGVGRDGQLGHGDTADVSIPRQIDALADVKIVAAAAGGGHTLLQADNGDVYAIGRGRNGQLGRADKLESVAAYRELPQKVEFFSGKTVKSIAAGSNHSLAVVDE